MITHSARRRIRQREADAAYRFIVLCREGERWFREGEGWFWDVRQTDPQIEREADEAVKNLLKRGTGG